MKITKDEMESSLNKATKDSDSISKEIESQINNLSDRLIENIEDNDIKYQNNFYNINNNTDEHLTKIKKIEEDIIDINSIIEEVECTINNLPEKITDDLKEKFNS